MNGKLAPAGGVFRDGLFPFNWAMPLPPGGADEHMFL